MFVVALLVRMQVFITMGQCDQQIYMYKFAGGGKEKKPLFKIELEGWELEKSQFFNRRLRRGQKIILVDKIFDLFLKKNPPPSRKSLIRPCQIVFLLTFLHFLPPTPAFLHVPMSISKN